jgi:ribosomal protein S12 methylthiotransferase accessory factor
MYDEASIEETLLRSRDLIHPHLGIIKDIIEAPQFPGEPYFFQYISILTNLARTVSWASFPKVGTGAALTRREAKVKAIGEAIERYCGCIYFKEDLIRSTFAELGDEAINLHDLPQCSLQEYGLCNAVFPIQANVPLDFTKVYSFLKHSELFVPASYIYLTHQSLTPTERITIPVSTGLACGHNLEAAILAGIYEVVERDALMLTWLKRLAVPKIDISRVDDRSIRERLNRLEAANLEPYFFHITMDIAIPSILMILIARSGLPPVLTVATATDADPLIALRRVIDEAVATRKYGIGHLHQFGRERPLFYDFSQIVRFEHHLFLYAYPGMESHMEFLLCNESSIDTDYLQQHFVIRHTLNDIINLLRSKDMDVLVADVTTADIADTGFNVVKVIIPKLQPLSPNHNARFLANPRIHEIHQSLGIKSRLTDQSAINEMPHPFA